MDTLLITHWRDKICTVLYSEERPQQITLESPKRPSRLNNIYIGKVQKIVPGIQAAFVDIAPGRRATTAWRKTSPTILFPVPEKS